MGAIYPLVGAYHPWKVFPSRCQHLLPHQAEVGGFAQQRRRGVEGWAALVKCLGVGWLTLVDVGWVEVGWVG